MKFLTVVGARPQFIKIFPVSREIQKKCKEVIVHTGQHYDSKMSKIFFKELNIPKPDYNLKVGSGAHGHQTGQMLSKIENVIFLEKPDCVLVYGDTNSTLAGALAAAKQNIPVAHVEAGLRSFNRNMPEEVNRIMVDHLSSILFCPSSTAVKNLKKEGITKNVHLVGDIMADSLRLAGKFKTDILCGLGLKKGKYLLATVHRAENTDNPEFLKNIIDAFNTVNETIIFPIHPRTRLSLNRNKLRSAPHIKITDPFGYLDMITLERHARLIMTDSGGIQKEAYWLGIPCITLRNETEWVETIESGWNTLTGADKNRILSAISQFKPSAKRPPLYGDGKAGSHIVRILKIFASK